MLAADRRACELEAAAGVDAQLTIQREVVLPAIDDRLGEQPGTRDAALDRPLGRLRDDHRRRVLLILLVLRAAEPGPDELRSHEPDHDERRGLFVFSNKQSNRLKILWWDRNGYCLLSKRPHQALFRLPAASGAPALAGRLNRCQGRPARASRH